MRQMTGRWYWAALELDAGSDERAVKRAYARQLKTTRPDEDLDAFQRLRTAYEHALEDLRGRAPASAQPAPDITPEPALPAPVPAEIVAAMPPPEPGPLEHATVPVATPAVTLPVGRHLQPGPAMSADTLARAAWNDVLATPLRDFAAVLTTMQADERLQSLEASDAFQVLALHHAASGACTAPLRAALIAHFDWNGQGAGFLRRYQHEAHAIFHHHAVDVNLGYLLQHAQSDPVLEYLFQDTVPDKLPQRWNGKFVRAMQETIATIHAHYPDVLAERMSHDVFRWWETQVANKKFFRQTAGWSSMVGIGLGMSLLVATPVNPDATGTVILFLVCQLLAIAGGAWAALRPPKTPQAGQRYFFGKPLLERRHHPGWQLGWMPFFGLFSVLMLDPDPGPALGSLILFAMTACAAMAILTASLAITRVRFCVAFVLSLGLVFVAHESPAFAFTPAWTLHCFGLALFTLFLSRGEMVYKILKLDGPLLALVRGGWLAIGAAIGIGLYADVVPMTEMPAMLMLLTLTGVLVARYNVHVLMIYLGVAFVGILAGPMRLNHGSLQFALTVPAMLTAWFVVTHLCSDTDE